jgi:hypothetical protein
MAYFIFLWPGIARHTSRMPLTSASTYAEILAAFKDNASYEEDGSRTKALAFMTACKFLALDPMSAGRGPQSMSRESYQQLEQQARDWLAGNPGTSGAGSMRTRFGDLSSFRD